MTTDAATQAIAAAAFADAAPEIAHDLRLLNAHLAALAEHARLLAIEDRLTEEAASVLLLNALRLEAWLRPGSLN
ncbi:MAG TPA: hypothetical protein VFG50_16125 [Rhodothermales bacterium]|nr:hypothetical protein [Rhodothermales bacterium]